MEIQLPKTDIYRQYGCSIKVLVSDHSIISCMKFVQSKSGSIPRAYYACCCLNDFLAVSNPIFQMWAKTAGSNNESLSSKLFVDVIRYVL